MGSSLGVSDTMALHLVEVEQHRAVLLLRAVPLQRGNGDAALPLRDRRRSPNIIQQLTIRNGHGLTGWVARNRRPLVNARPSADLEAAGHARPTGRRCSRRWSARCSSTSASSARFRSITPSRRSTPTTTAGCSIAFPEQAAAVIYNSIVFEQTQEDSLTDPLTGLPNTRFMFMHLTRELARAERLKSEVSLLVMDLDNFKDINDTYGHHVGDRALREVAGVLRTAIRPYDICVRYAGDEFIVVLSGCGGEEAERKRLELQRAVDSLQFEARPGKMLPLAISVGAAVFPHDGDSYETLLATADSRMYATRPGASAKSTRRPGHRTAEDRHADDVRISTCSDRPLGFSKSRISGLWIVD